MYFGNGASQLGSLLVKFKLFCTIKKSPFAYLNT